LIACSLGGERGFSAIFLRGGFRLLRGARRSAIVAAKKIDDFCFLKYQIVLWFFFKPFHVSESSRMADARSPRPSRSVSPAARAPRLASASSRACGASLADRGKPAGRNTGGDALGRSAAERPERTSPEQVFENAQNGKGQLLAKVGMRLDRRHVP
jgi:hypothetical protein